MFSFYERWYVLAKRFPKQDRFLIGAKVDSLLLESLVSILQASHASRSEKRPLLQQASREIDAIKILLRLGYRIKTLTEKQYIATQRELNEIGKMLGGWLRSVT